MKRIKSFSQLFENQIQLRPSRYWVFDTYIEEKNKIARFLVSGDSTRSITRKFLETLLPEYLGFDSLYTLSSDIAPPEIDNYDAFNEWVYQNIEELSASVGIIDNIYISGKEILNGKDFPEFIAVWNNEWFDRATEEEYTEISGNPDSIAWLLWNYLKYSNAFGENYGDRIIVIFDLFNSKVGDTLEIKNGDLAIWEKYPDILRSLFNSNESDQIYDYFKENPLELHMVHDPQLKEMIREKTGIMDFGKIGGLLKNGLI
jgi:hypothetical protein